MVKNSKIKLGFTLAKGATHLKLLPSMERFGFTLAEVLITLGIIGVVAAMTIPNLLQHYSQEATVNKLKKTISVLNQAYRLSFDDVGEPGADQLQITSTEYFNTYWAPYIKVSNFCSTYKACGYSKVSPWTNANGTPTGWYIVEPRLRTSFITLDGVAVVPLFSSWADDDGGKGEKKKNVFEIIVDINAGEKPNKLGRDVFYLTRVTENGGGIRPYGFEKSNDEINQNCSKTGRGEYCAEKIRRAGWKIDKSYPWK